VNPSLEISVRTLSIASFEASLRMTTTMGAPV
jgi:hypothetical protein